MSQQSKYFAHITELCSEIKKDQWGDRLIVTASPGSGKTTQIPWALTQLTNKKVLVLEPRRIAAISAADYVARINHKELGQEIGYQVRFENRSSSLTQLLFLTEALLLKKLMNDPNLNDVGIVVLDEFHERSLDVDIALACLKELQALSRPDLKIVVMSATLETEKLKTYLNPCTHLDVSHSQHPLETIFQKEPLLLQTDRNFIERVAKTVQSVFHSAKKDISALVFLPGVSEIERVASELQAWSEQHAVPIFKLHGSISLNEQKSIVQSEKLKRVILATNIAESSLTIDGINTVIDSGLTRNTQLNYKTHLLKLQTERLSLFSAKQRAGRANRQSAGTVVKLWNKTDELSMKQTAIPEIHRNLLDEAFLLLSSLKITDWKSFSWFESPLPEIAQRSLQVLTDLQAIDATGNITQIGRQLLKFPLSLKLSRVLHEGIKLHTPRLASDIVAILSERDFMLQASHSSQHMESDLTERLMALKEFRHNQRVQGVHVARLQSVQQVAEQVFHLTNSPLKEEKIENENIYSLLLPFFKEQICAKRPGAKTALCVSGYGVRIADQSAIKNSEFFLALQMFESPQSPDPTASLSIGLNKDVIKKYFADDIKASRQIVLSDTTQEFFVEETMKLGAIIIDKKERRRAMSLEVEELLIDYLKANPQEFFTQNESAQKLRLKWNFIESVTQTPVLSEEQLSLLLESVAYGEASLKHVYEKDVSAYCEQALGKDVWRQLEKAYPSHLTTPKGKTIPVHYSAEKGPSIEVKIQDAFGWIDTPKIADGKVKLTVVLLAPNMRPTQVTQDLYYFWKNSYKDVRKELRARYPKHSWPEDPTGDY